MQLIYNHFLNHTGYSIAAQDYILSILRVSHNFDIRSIPYNTSIRSGISVQRQQFFNQLINKKVNNPFTCFSHSTPDRFVKLKGASLNAGFCIFETITIPDHWVKHMNTMDLIVTASDFNRLCFINCGVKQPIKVVPHAFDELLFNKSSKNTGRYKLFTFLSIGTWRKRKNWETLIKSFYEAFEQKDEVCLLIKTDKLSEMQSLITKTKQMPQWKSKQTAPIFLENKALCSFEEIPEIIKKADVYVNASLGEGYGLSGMQALAMNIPILITKFGGSLEYAKPEFSTYIEPNGYSTLPNMDNFPQFKNAIWPQIEINEVAEKMKYMKTNYSDVMAKTEKGYNFVHMNMSYNAIGPKILSALGINHENID